MTSATSTSSVQPLVSSTEAETIAAFARRRNLPFREVTDGTVAADFLAAIPISLARRHLTVVLTSPEVGEVILLGKPEGFPAVDIVRRVLGRFPPLFCADGEKIRLLIDRSYEGRNGLAADAILAVRHEEAESIDSFLSRHDLLESADRTPLINVVNMILFEAAKIGASDIHIQPTNQDVAIRFRIDGALHDSFELPKAVQEELISRIKVMAQMNVAETRLAQDGRAAVTIGNRSIDLRLSSIPTSHGERIVIRLLDKGASLLRLDQLGMGAETLRSFRRLVAAEHGLLLVTGPTGSGKSTTLYAAMQELDSVSQNILTIEDPIEYELKGISQTPVNNKKGMTFASALRNVLRQDPDVVMVGEIRDPETAHMAVQAALTGHLVLSTLHTNDAASAVSRLLDLGIEPFLLSSCLIGAIAQRLVRRPCDRCGVDHDFDAVDRRLFASAKLDVPTSERIGTGCEACRMTGYKRRIGVFELLSVDAEMASLITRRATSGELRAAAVNRCGTNATLLADGLAKVAQGLTTCAEVRKVAFAILAESVSI